ncbi:YkvA family protein [Microbacterium rhizophilus]|uniref:YkvA family protein n=1 Tax=Microbacterium rhizophilus TaxID=3138934 RepID=UPI0031ED6F4D
MDKRKVTGAVLLGAAALVYGVSPIDLIPDVLLPLGIADDATFLVGAALGVWKLLSSARKKKPKD